MNLTDLHYVAGLLEGEGSFHICNGLVIEAKMTDREPLDRVKSVLGGKVTGPFVNGGNPKFKKVFRYELRRKSGSVLATRLLFPLMSPRRQKQMRRIIDTAKSRPPHDLSTRRKEIKAERNFPIC